MALADQIVGVESGGNPYATNSRSSAAGAGQFIRSTWLDMIRRHRPDLAQGRDEQGILALRANPILSRQMTDAYAQENGQKLASAGFEATPGNTYLAHFAGPGGAVSVLRADPAAPLGPILGDKVMAANPFLANMTAGQLRSWADRKMGASIPPRNIPLPAAEPEASPQVAGAVPTVGAAPAGPMLDNAYAMAPRAPPPMAPNAAPPPQAPPPQIAPARLANAALGVPGQSQLDPAIAAWWARQNSMGG